jgi:hypothetical protein
MNQDYNYGQIFIRQTQENHRDQAPACDDACWLRWYDMAHIHVCPDGINDPTPFMTVTCWCSCGARLSEPFEFDSRRRSAMTEMAENGRLAFEAFQVHALEVHQIDIETNEEWQRRLETPPASPL